MAQELAPKLAQGWVLGLAQESAPGKAHLLARELGQAWALELGRMWHLGWELEWEETLGLNIGRKKGNGKARQGKARVGGWVRLGL